ncbi:MAG: hypothetical protein HYU99_01650 [Deltaproteobacteria bacterium]|nr:hypothetical protein [Deltaproteobacteria bacterium]
MVKKLPLGILLAASFFLSGSAFAKTDRVPGPRADQTLTLALDAIPYSLVKELYDKGYMAGYSAPSLVISPFPSTTTSGFTGMMMPIGADRALGYDAIYYSYGDDRVKGSLLTALKENYNDYEKFFDFYRHSFGQKFLIYAAPGVSVQRDIDRLKVHLWKHPEKKTLFFYIGGTDGTAHVLGKKRHAHILRHIFKRLDTIRARYRRDFGRELKVVIFSDHGFHYRHLKGIETRRLEKMLKEKGYHLAKNLNGDRSVVVTEWGNISGASFFTHKEDTEPVARILNELSGNDLTFFVKGKSIRVLSKERGEARIDFTAGGKHFRYVEITGDPLNYGDVNPGGFASDRRWFEATHHHYYPDALRRIYDAFFTLVKNPATILCSTRDDYEFGDPVTRFSSKLHGGLKGTHGGMFFTASSAFVTTNIPGLKLPPVLRYSEVFKILKSPTPPL